MKIKFLFLLFFTLCAKANSQDLPSSFFTETSILKIQIKTDIKSLVKNKGKVKKLYQTDIQYINNKNDTVHVPAQLRTRGNFRLKYCKLPPIKIYFDSIGSRGTVFENLEHLKLVTHCRKSKKYQAFLVKEYLAYKIYNLLTDYSYRVRLAEITYVDMHGKYKNITRLGFFIEPSRKLAQRNSTQIFPYGAYQKELDNETVTRMALFEYLIGNTDWAVIKRHNVKLFRASLTATPIAVPYDFDWSGFVNPPYAVPAAVLEISSVRERVYRGYKQPIEEFQSTIRLFNENKVEIDSLVKNLAYLNSKQKKKLQQYIDEFYDIINTPESLNINCIDNARE